WKALHNLLCTEMIREHKWRSSLAGERACGDAKELPYVRAHMGLTYIERGKMQVSKLPALRPEDFGGVFTLPEGREVTSLALTPNGCYVVVGFVDGVVRLFAPMLDTLGAAKRSGCIIGRIMPKGMHNSLRMNVATSEDCRFCFAGVLRGSMELIAVDLSRLPNWETQPSKKELGALGGPVDLKPLIGVHRHADAKLKGFGAATRVRDSSGADTEYRLFCGRGIKSIHIWSFRPYGGGGDNGGGSGGDSGGVPVWQCIYDTQTNGMTVELVAFRNGGREGVSKSDDQLLRLWTLSGPERRPQCRDIPNSRDAKGVFNDFAYGGLYQLSMVRIDADEWANRTELALPPPTGDGDGDGESGGGCGGKGGGSGGGGGLGSGNASPGAMLGRTASSGSASHFYGRRRHCRMIKTVTGTPDGRHVLLVCSDGQVLYHRHTEAVNRSFLPLGDLLADPEELAAVAIGLVGRTGLPVAVVAGSRDRLEVKVLPRTKDQEEADVAALAASMGEAGPTAVFGWQEYGMPEGDGDGGGAPSALTAAREDSEDEEDDEDEDEDDSSSQDKGSNDEIAAAAAVAAGREREREREWEQRQQSSGGSGKKRSRESIGSIDGEGGAGGRDSPGRGIKRGGGSTGGGGGERTKSESSKRRKSDDASAAADDGNAAETGGGSGGSGKKGKKRSRDTSGGDAAAEGGSSGASAANARAEGAADAMDVDTSDSRQQIDSGAGAKAAAAAAAEKAALTGLERAPGHGASMAPPRSGSGGGGGSKDDGDGGRQNVKMTSSKSANRLSFSDLAGAGLADEGGSTRGSGNGNSRSSEQSGGGGGKSSAADADDKLSRKPGRPPATPRKEKDRDRGGAAAAAAAAVANAAANAAANAESSAMTAAAGKRPRRSNAGVAVLTARDGSKPPADLPAHLLRFLAERRRRRARELEPGMVPPPCRRTSSSASSGGEASNNGGGGGGGGRSGGAAGESLCGGDAGAADGDSPLTPKIAAAATAATAAAAAAAAMAAATAAAATKPELDQLLQRQEAERQSLGRAFRTEQERVRRGFLAAVDRARLAKQVEAAGIEVQHGCVTVSAAWQRLRERADRSQVPLESVSRRTGALTRRDAHDLAAGLVPAGGGGCGNGGGGSGGSGSGGGEGGGSSGPLPGVANGWN
ncbi:unnamed protein product, partial [Phaeothamnion confervicola]